MYAFARRPRWIAGHLLAATLLFVFVVAGLWQLDRHRQRRNENGAVAARSQMVPLPGTALGDLDPATDEYRSIEVQGRWLAGEQVLIRNRSHSGVGGCHLAAPLDPGTYPAVLVVLGWLPGTSCTDADIEFGSDRVKVVGRLRISETRGRFGPTDPAEGRLDSLARTDVGRIAQQLSVPLATMYIEAVTIHPGVEGLSTIEAPPLDGGPHLGYAVQWFLFFGVGAVGYPLVLRHHARRGQLDDV